MEDGKNIGKINLTENADRVLHEATMRIISAKEHGEKIAKQTDAQTVVTVFHETAVGQLADHLATDAEALNRFLLINGHKTLSEPTQ